MFSSYPQTVRTTIHPTRPDIRQSICHTLLAASFILVGVLNPFAHRGGTQASFHGWMMVALVIVVGFSWFFLVRLWLKWRELPRNLKAIQYIRARQKPSRAKSHALMSMLAILLAAFAFVGRAVLPNDEGSLLDEALFYTGATIVIIATAVLAQSVRDLLAIRRRVKRLQNR